MFKRYLIEFGHGADLHGGDVNTAAIRAVENARRNCCMAGMIDIFGITEKEKVKVQIKLSTPKPQEVDQQKILSVFEDYSTPEIEVVEGGATAKGLHVDKYGPGDDILIAIAILTVYLDV